MEGATSHLESHGKACQVAMFDLSKHHCLFLEY